MKTTSNIPLRDFLALLAVIALAVMIAFPAASTARSSGKSTLCLANLHILGKAWLGYAEDNDSRIVGSATYEWDGWQTKRYPAWAPTTTIRVRNFVGVPHNAQTHADSYASVDNEIRGIQQGGLWPYIEMQQPYRCPTDSRYLKKAPRNPNRWGGYRTYSIGCPLNGYANGDGWATGEYYATVYKSGEIVSPESKMVFVEETEASGYNENTWDIFLIGSTFPNYWPGDPLYCAHNRQTSLGFADGHVELHLWQDPAVIRTFVDQVKNNPLYSFSAAEGADLCWFVRHYIPRPPESQFQGQFYPLPK
jgi:prepilin-type processing-associated H-X9-DG protein